MLWGDSAFTSKCEGGGARANGVGARGMQAAGGPVGRRKQCTSKALFCATVKWLWNLIVGTPFSRVPLHEEFFIKLKFLRGSPFYLNCPEKAEVKKRKLVKNKLTNLNNFHKNGPIMCMYVCINSNTFIKYLSWANSSLQL